MEKLQRTTKKTHFLFVLVISISAAILFNACGSWGGESFGGENCDGYDADARHPLSKAQKDFGNFKKGESIHYTHSDGYEFNLKTINDTLFWQARDASPCIDGKEEIHEVTQKSDYPIFYLSISTSSEFMSISVINERFYIPLDSTGIDEKSDDYNSIKLHDSLEINGNTYKDVHEVCNMDEEEPKACIFLSKKKGVLKVKFEDGSEISIVKSRATKE